MTAINIYIHIVINGTHLVYSPCCSEKAVVINDAEAVFSTHSHSVRESDINSCGFHSLTGQFFSQSGKLLTN